MPTPRRSRQVRMCRVSSLESTFSITEVPSASAASGNARLVMLLEPGTRQDASRGPVRAGIASGPAGMGRAGCERPVPTQAGVYPFTATSRLAGSRLVATGVVLHSPDHVDRLRLDRVHSGDHRAAAR